MRSLSVFLRVSCLIFATVPPVSAGGIDNKHNYSAEYVRILNRNAATDSADGVVYNPAGTVKMEDGLYLSMSGQYVFKDYSNTYSGTEYDSDEPDIVPGLFGLYKRDRWVAFAAFTIPCGGGTVNYEDGSKTTQTIAQGTMENYNATYFPLLGGNVYDGTIKAQRMEGESFYYGYTAGGACALNDTVSVSLGLRYIDARIDRKGSATLSRTPAGILAGVPKTFVLDYEEKGDGWAAIVGVNIVPKENLNIGLRYETKTSLRLATHKKTDDIGLITDGSKRRRDLPALLGLGVSYDITPKLRAEGDLTGYFNKDAKWDDDALTSADETEKSNGYDTGLALEYVFGSGLKGSLGYMYTETGISPDNMSIEAPQLDAQTLAAGLAYALTPDLDMNLGILWAFYDDEIRSDGTELEKEVTILALGFQYRL